MRSFLQDLRFSGRQLLKSPGFTLAAVLSLGLGIGASTAVFSIVYAVVLAPYPYRNSERMVHLVLNLKNGRESWIGLTGPQFRELRQTHAVESAVAQDQWNLTVTGSDLPEDVNAVYFTGNGFQHFGDTMLLGRALQPSDAPEDGDPQPVAVLGHSFWLRHYNGDRDVVGKTIQLVHKNYTIIGVAPPRFTWGDGDIYLPLRVNNDPSRAYQVNTKLKPGVTHAAADAEFQRLFEEFARETPKHFPPLGSFRTKVQGLNENFIHRIGTTLTLLLCAVGLLLAIGCTNVSILLLARGTTREHEFAVRAAIGASRARIIRQLLTEAVGLALVGAGLGVLLAYRTVSGIVTLLPQFSFPHEAAIKVNLPVLCFSVVLSIVTAIFFGLTPALRFSRPEVAQVMQASAKRTLGGVRGKQMHRALIAAQIALTMLLLAAAGGAIEGFRRMNQATLGYNPHNVMSVGIPVHDNSYTTWEKRAAYFQQLLDRVSAMPQVTIAGISSNATPPSNGFDNQFDILGTATLEQQHARLNMVSPEYFRTLEIPLLQGRLWDRAESARAAHVAVINQTMASQYFPGGDAVGQHIRMPRLKPDPPITVGTTGSDDWMEVIGVVADARDDGLAKPVKPGIYVPFTIWMAPWTQILVRSEVPPLTILNDVRRQLLMVDPDQQAAGHVQSLEEWITGQQEWAQQHLVALLLGAFAGLALLLAAGGLYSVVSYTVAQRTNEFGVRVALGAMRGDILRLVYASTAASVAGGLVIGVTLSLALSRLLTRLSEGSSIHAGTTMMVAAVLVAVAVLACTIPARRASAVDPMQALRYE
jgi:predicted permease